MANPPYFLVFEGSVGRGNWATYSYVDASLARKDQQLIDLKYYTDSSFGLRDLSINALFAGVGQGYNNMKIYVDGSLAKRDSSISDLYTKVGSGYNTMKIYVDASLVKRDSSISDLYTKVGAGDAAMKIYVDGSLSFRDTSISWNTTRNLQQDVSIAFLEANRNFVNLKDVDIIGPSNFQFPKFNGSSNKWDVVDSVNIDNVFYKKVDIWTLEPSNNGILFNWGGVHAMYLDTSGNLLVKGTITQNSSF